MWIEVVACGDRGGGLCILLSRLQITISIPADHHLYPYHRYLLSMSVGIEAMVCRNRGGDY